MWSSTLEFVRIFSESMDGHHYTGNPVLQPNHFPQKDPQAPVGTLAQTSQQGPVVLEIDSQQDGNAENVLPVGNRKEDILVQVMSEKTLLGFME